MHEVFIFLYIIFKNFYFFSQVFGMNEEWLGGDVRVTTGGAHKLNMLKKGLEEYKDQKNLVLLFTDRFVFVII